MKKVLFIVLAILAINFNCFALYDDFEDGEYSSNPIWSLTNTSGADSIVQDPLRTNNKVLAMYGTSSAHRRIASSANYAFNDFYFEAEYMASSANFYPIFSLVMENGDNFRTRLQPDGVNTKWSIVHNAYNGPGWLIAESEPPIILDQPIQEWWKMTMWYNEQTSEVNAEIYKVSDSSLIFSRTYEIPIEFENNTISEITIEAAELDLQYFDNITLIPEPATLLLLGLGGLMLNRKRRPQNSEGQANV